MEDGWLLRVDVDNDCVAVTCGGGADSAAVVCGSGTDADASEAVNNVSHIINLKCTNVIQAKTKRILQKFVHISNRTKKYQLLISYAVSKYQTS